MSASNQSPKRVGPELSAVIRRLAADPECEQPVTLAQVRAELEKIGLQWRDGELLNPQDRTAQIIEIDDLIEQCGENASALDFVVPDSGRA